jgi:GT2 family glycosyltransferase
MPQDFDDGVSIVVLTWNSRDLVPDAVASCLEQTRPAAEVVVFDNDSADGTPQLVAQRFGSQVRIVHGGANLGYAGGNNAALAVTRGAFVLFLNPDARLAPDFLEHAMPAFDDPRVGAVAGLLLREDETTVDSSGLFLGRSRKVIDRGFDEPFDPQRDRPGPVLGPCGAVALYRRRTIEDVADDGAFFDPDYFAYNEDLEVAWRCWRAGWTAVHRPEARAVHLRGGGAKRGRLGMTFDRDERLVAHIVRNRYLALLRHEGVGSFLIDLPFIAARDLAMALLVLARRPRVLSALWRERALFGRARAKRRGDRSREGAWGRWRHGTPPRGVWRPRAR